MSYIARHVVIGVCATLTAFVIIGLFVITAVHADGSFNVSRGQVFGYVGQDVTTPGGNVELFVNVTSDVRCDYADNRATLTGAEFDGDGIALQVVQVRGGSNSTCVLVMREIDNTPGPLTIRQGSPLYWRSIPNVTLPDYQATRPAGYVADDSGHPDELLTAVSYGKGLAGKFIQVGKSRVRVTEVTELTSWPGMALVHLSGNVNTSPGQPFYLLTK